MRNKTFISSMAGIAAAVAVAGSASAGVIDAFTVAGTGGNPQPSSPFESRELFYGSGMSTASANAVVNTTNNTLAITRDASATGTFAVQWTNWSDGVNPGTGLDWTGLQSISFTIASTTGGSLNLTVASMDSNDSMAGRRLRWLNFNVGAGTTNVVLNVGSTYGGGTFQQESNFNVSAVNLVQMRVNGGGLFDGTISNFQYNIVPAPGAAALLGAAGLVGGRRRKA